MAITFNSAGTPVYAFNSTVTPTAPTDVAGTGLILVTGELIGSDTISTPVGWTALDLVSGAPQAPQVRAFGLIATGSDTMPSISWGNQWAFAVVLAFNGLDSGFAAAFSPAGRQTNQTNVIQGPAVSRTPSQNGALFLFYGQRDKTSTTDGTTYSAPTNFTMAGSGSAWQHAGTSVSVGISYWIQSTATAVGANQTMTGSLTEGTAQACQGVYAGILAASSVIPYPPTSLGGMNVQVCQ